MVRTADVKRGWGKFYSKSCKAKFQNRTRNKYHNEVRTVDGVEAGPNDVFTDQDHEDCLDSIEGA
ncbi:MAG: hypothetical protein GY941_23500 [Planctomycetes bacterium]|nr:hypothetical protein [Planctomycetota bacterium]